MHAPTFVVVFSPSSFLRHTKRFLYRNPSQHFPRRCARQLIWKCSTSGEPPQVKSSFYKNPSKAIEKGGGFYIPGFRGPRLRIFVAAVGFTLLSINHLASIRSPMVIPSSFTVSEIDALIALLCVISTAYLDTATQLAEQSEIDDVTVEPAVSTLQTNYKTGQVTSSHARSTEQVFEWVALVAAQMTSTDGVYMFDGDSLVFSSAPVLDQIECGTVVARVARENKALYVDDSKCLPSGVDMPFLSPSESGRSVFLVPIRNGNSVVVFSSALDSGRQPKLASVGDRNWLTQCALRIQAELG